MANKVITNASIVTALNDTDYAFINQGSSLKQVLVSTLVSKVKAQAASQVESDLLDQLTDGCMVMYHRKSDGYPICAKASSWTSLQNSGEVADGVIIMQAGGSGHHLVVAPTEASLYWSSSAVQVTSPFTDNTDRRAAMDDFAGQAHTAAIVANATLSADGSDYAPGYCYAYSRTTTTSEGAAVGLSAGRWWLPSVGELWAVFANRQKVNALLNLISGATTLGSNWYWSSTEGNATCAWCLYFGDGNLNLWVAKVSRRFQVRPVSAFYN